MLTQLSVRQFRCFESAQIAFGGGRTCIVGPNAAGKTSLLEAICLLLRLQSPRAASAKQAIRFGQQGFAVEGIWNGARCQYYYSAARRKLLLDAVEQRRANEYLQLARVVWFGNDDLDLLRGGAEGRRKFLDFLIVQMNPLHRRHLLNYDKALRSRNLLLKRGATASEIAAYNGPLVQAGAAIREARAAVITSLNPETLSANQKISGDGQTLRVEYRDGSDGNFSYELQKSRAEETRLRQTIIGPHRDDLLIFLEDQMASAFASEGQQRTAVLALRLAQMALLSEGQTHPPLLLIDDVFGELDIARRNRLLAALPPEGQQIITTTHLDWADLAGMRVLRVEDVR